MTVDEARRQVQEHMAANRKCTMWGSDAEGWGVAIEWQGAVTYCFHQAQLDHVRTQLQAAGVKR